jgi:hypothetical protein
MQVDSVHNKQVTQNSILLYQVTSLSILIPQLYIIFAIYTHTSTLCRLGKFQKLHASGVFTEHTNSVYLSNF